MYAKTTQIKPDQIERKWLSIDASGQTLGRLASNISKLLQGKHKAIYSGHLDAGDFVVITNADKVTVTGKKLIQKIYFRHSGYPGGDKYESLGKLMNRRPEKVLYLAVKGMLPKNKLRARMLKRLKIYSGAKHPHSAQFLAK